MGGGGGGVSISIFFFTVLAYMLHTSHVIPIEIIVDKISAWKTIVY